MTKSKDPPDPLEEPEPPAPEDFAARRLKEFLQGRFPGEPLPPGLPEDEQPEEQPPEDEAEQDDIQDQNKQAKEVPKRKPHKSGGPQKPKRDE